MNKFQNVVCKMAAFYLVFDILTFMDVLEPSH